ncbi:MAG: DUF2071 domain-containing protein [Isosphaeraceae bacterium]|nr:DUF2071 domain-containing protein [Isosphaeraceae bacterium]
MPDTPTVIDRVAPARRPERRVVMHQSWRQLLFLHWEFPAPALQARLPAGLELDTFEGRAFVGLVPFTMLGVRPAGLPAFRPLSDFHETNVRTYVHFEGRDPGVWFFSLDAANSLAVLTARAWFHLPYHRARMRLDRDPATGTTRYQGRRLWPGPLPARYALEAAPRGHAATAAVGTLEHFLAERYLLYAAHRDRLYREQVHHRPYPLQPADSLAIDENLLAAAGLTRPEHPPLAHYAVGVDVEVFPLEAIR